MPQKSALCPYLAPSRSRALVLFILGAHALSFLAAWLNPLPIWIRFAISLGVLLSLWLTLGRKQAETGIVGLKPNPSGTWNLHTSTGAAIEANLLGASVVSPWFVLMQLRAENQRHSVLICRDSLEPDAFRRLRVALRVAGTVE